MTDFHAQLERQLVDAARRRAQRGRWRATLAGRGRPLLAMATVLLAGVAVAASISLLGAGSFSSAPGGGGGAPPAPGATMPTMTGTATAAPPDASRPTMTATPPPHYEPLPSRPLRGTLVAVYNATTTSGLAREAADRLETQGATIDAVGSSADQQQAHTVVGHRPGAGAQARLVATILGVRDIHPMTTAEAVLSPRADVVVQVGADRGGG